MEGYFDISTTRLVMAFGLVLIAIGVSWKLRLGLARTFVVAAMRCVGQLLLLGYVLSQVLLKYDRPEVTLGVLAMMIFFAAVTVRGRLKNNRYGVFWPALGATALVGLTVTFVVVVLIIGVRPWYRAMYIIPLAGMIFGNTMNGIALSLERTFADLDLRGQQIRALIALGATPWEASLPSVRSALMAGLTPIINTMVAVGLVHIPGIMTGQLLAGQDPVRAARYQIVVMFMLAAATSLGAIVSIRWAYGKAFNAYGAPRD